MHEILQKLQRELADGLSGLSAEQTQRRRAPEKWSIQQIVEHLLLSYEATAAAVEARVLKGTPTRATATPRQRLAQFVVTGLGVFPQGRLAPETVRPAGVTVRAISAGELNERAAELLFPMDAILTEAEKMFGAKERAVTHPVLGPMSAGQWRRFHLVHGEHHLRQVLGTRRALGI